LGAHATFDKSSAYVAQLKAYPVAALETNDSSWRLAFAALTLVFLHRTSILFMEGFDVERSE